MEVALYLIAATVLFVLIVLTAGVRRRAEPVDGDEALMPEGGGARAPPPRAEERAAGAPRRRRRDLNARVAAQRRAQREPSDNEEVPEGGGGAIGGGESDQEEEQQNLQATGKVGAKKQRKLEEKQAKRAHREAELGEREERKKLQELRDQERRKEEERERLSEQKEEEEEHRLREEERKREEEEYLKLKASFIVEEQGEAEPLSEDQSRNLLQEFIQYIEDSKVVLLEDLASHFGMRTQDAIARLQDLLAEGSLTGVIDDRGKFISISPEELSAVARFIQQRGRVSIAELAQASNSLINLTPVLRNQA
ncbi:DDRGK domain-containing protein 1 [Gadus morhua]|uniref:DDRGK domain-containing protein 1 n=1 Tax=Gadus morhua TaxID=8049 RepID=UPI0011B6FC98|nr:DDRGK domain-containing protein 1 [Gadus morhua]